MKKLLTWSFFIILFSLSIRADVRVDPPKTKPGKSIETLLRVDIERGAKEAKLIIPKAQLKQLRAELEGLDDGSETTAALSFTRAQTVVSGMFLSLAVVFGGVWLARSRKFDTRAGKILVIGAVLFLSGTVATIVYANAGPPPEARVLTNKFFSPGVNIYKFGSGKIKLETSDTVDHPTLIVPDIPDEKKPAGEE
jgi:hypothetical protein